MQIDLFLFFFIYAFLGWCAEVVYAGLTEGMFINRGFLNGTWCPIYGIAVIAVVNLLEPIKNNLLFLFLGSVAITSIVELFTGFVLEKIFHQKWWDYSDKPFNLGGYICPLFSIAWGFACLIVIDKIHPMLSRLINMMPYIPAIIAIIILSTAFIVDLIATVNTVFKLNKKLDRINEISFLIKKSSNEIGENLASGAIYLADKKQELDDKVDVLKAKLETNLRDANRLGHRRLLKAFPGIKSERYKDTLNLLKDYILKRK